jgi:hypothetical protein
VATYVYEPDLRWDYSFILRRFHLLADSTMLEILSRKRWKSFIITANQRFFLCPRPALDMFFLIKGILDAVIFGGKD